MSNNKNTFWSELRRRNIFRVATVYMIVGWIIIQIADATFEPLQLPSWSLTLLIVFLVIGLPIALILAWAYEMSPQGMIRTSSQEAKENPYSKRKKKPLTGNLVIGVLIIVVIAQFLYFKNIKAENNISKESSMSEISIAVLAFDDQSPNSDQEWLGDGVADEILNVLAQNKDLKVIGKTSSFYFKEKNATTKEIGEILDVKTVLEGSVSRVGDKLRITAQLIDVETEAHIWSDRYDRDADDIFAIVVEVAQSIVGSLMSELSMEEVNNIKMAYQPKIEAFEYFIKAEFIHDEYAANDYVNNDFFLEAKEMYAKAISIDPDYLDALAGLANLYDSRGNNPNSREKDWSKRDSILNVAYQIDPNAPYVLYLKGLRNSNFDSAFSFLKKAYDLDPNNKGIYLLVLKFYGFGLYDLCISFSKKYLAKDPLNKRLQRTLASSLWRSGQIEEAREQVTKLLDFDADHYYANSLLFDIKLLIDRDIVGAKRILNKLNKLSSDSPFESDKKAILLAIEGRKEEALVEDSGLDIYILLNMKREALSIMDQEINSLDIPYVRFLSYLNLKTNPFFDNIREEPQFQQWLKEAKEVHEERVRKYGHLFEE